MFEQKNECFLEKSVFSPKIRFKFVMQNGYYADTYQLYINV